MCLDFDINVENVCRCENDNKPMRNNKSIQVKYKQKKTNRRFVQKIIKAYYA